FSPQLTSRNNIDNFVVNRLNFLPTAVAYTLTPLSGLVVQFAGVNPALTQDSASAINLSVPLDFSVATTLDGSCSGDLTLAVGALSGAAGFTQTSPGRLILSGTSSTNLGSTGGINLSAGSTEVQSVTALGPNGSSANTVSISNAKLSFNLTAAGTRTTAASYG